MMRGFFYHCSEAAKPPRDDYNIRCIGPRVRGGSLVVTIGAASAHAYLTRKSVERSFENSTRLACLFEIVCINEAVPSAATVAYRPD